MTNPTDPAEPSRPAEAPSPPKPAEVSETWSQDRPGDPTMGGATSYAPTPYAPPEPVHFDPPATAVPYPDPAAHHTGGPGTSAPDTTASDTVAMPGASGPDPFAAPSAYPPPTHPGSPYPGATTGYPAGAPQDQVQPYPQQPYGQPYPQQPYPQPYGRPYSPYGQPGAASLDTGLAVGALVCSLIGLLTCLVAVPGVIMGHIALSKANRGEAGGRGMALAAVVIGYVIIALYVGFFVTFILLGVNGYLGP